MSGEQDRGLLALGRRQLHCGGLEAPELPELVGILGPLLLDRVGLLDGWGAEHIDVDAGQQCLEAGVLAVVDVVPLLAHRHEVLHGARIVDVAFAEEVELLPEIGPEISRPPGLRHRLRCHVLHRTQPGDKAAGPDSHLLVRGPGGGGAQIGILGPRLDDEIGLETPDDVSGALASGLRFEPGDVVLVPVRSDHRGQLPARARLDVVCDIHHPRLRRPLGQAGRSEVDKDVLFVFRTVFERQEKAVAEADVVGANVQLLRGFRHGTPPQAVARARCASAKCEFSLDDRS